MPAWATATRKPGEGRVDSLSEMWATFVIRLAIALLGAGVWWVCKRQSRLRGDFRSAPEAASPGSRILRRGNVVPTTTFDSCRSTEKDSVRPLPGVKNMRTSSPKIGCGAISVLFGSTGPVAVTLLSGGHFGEADPAWIGSELRVDARGADARGQGGGAGSTAPLYERRTGAALLSPGVCQATREAFLYFCHPRPRTGTTCLDANHAPSSIANLPAIR